MYLLIKETKMTNEHDPTQNYLPEIPGYFRPPNKYDEIINQRGGPGETPYDPLDQQVEDLVAEAEGILANPSRDQEPHPLDLALAEFFKRNPHATQAEARSFLYRQTHGYIEEHENGTHTLHWDGEPPVTIREDGEIA